MFLITTGFASTDEDDVIDYDVDACKRSIISIREKMDELVNSCNSLVDDLVVFQSVNHDTQGHAIYEDYKDIATIFGDEGFNSFVDTLSEYLDSIEQTLNYWAATTQR